MTYSEAIKEGFRVINRNWQLVLVQLVLTVLGCMGFFFVVAIPLLVILLIVGISPAFLSQFMHSPDILLTQYFSLVLAGGVLLLLYILAVTTAGLYVFGASSGTISRTVRDETQKFSMKVFFEEGKRLFFPVMGFTAIVGLIAIGVIACYILAGIAISIIITYAKAQSLTLSMFLGVFFALIGVISGFFILFGLLSLTVYGVAAIALKDSRPVAAVNETIRYLIKKPSAFWFYVLLAFMYLVFSITLSLIGLPLRAIPFIGLILTFPYQILVYALQGYAGLFILSVAFVYYYRTDPSLRTTQSEITEVTPDK